MSEPRKENRSAVAPILIAVLVVAVFILGCNSIPHEPPGERNNIATRRMLSRLIGETEMMVIHSHEMPRTLRDLIGRLDAEGAFDHECRLSYPGIERGIDAWGNELVVVVEDSSRLVLRSKGRNGRDDRGQGDDLERTLDCRQYLVPDSDSKAQ